MKQKVVRELTRELFQLLKQFPRLKLKRTLGLTPGAQELLLMLALHSEGNEQALTVTGVSNLLQITPAAVTHLLNPLEKTGYIERLPDPADRRIVRIGLTAKGNREARALLSDAQKNMAEMFNLLGEEDSRTFIRLLSKVVGHFSS